MIASPVVQDFAEGNALRGRRAASPARALRHPQKTLILKRGGSHPQAND
jgi:hypothetical protein